jgi:hypothetical protein
MTDADRLASIKTLYLTALAEDAANPRPDYSIDGQSVSRESWRAGLFARVKDIDELAQAAEPYELRSVIP